MTTHPFIKLVLLFCSGIWGSHAIGSEAPLLPDEQSTVLSNTAAAILDNYVYATRAHEIASEVEQWIESDRYSRISERAEFARILTADLLEISGDKHFVVNFNPGFIAERMRLTNVAESEGGSERQMPTTEPAIDWNLWYSTESNFGIPKVEILAGNIGYLKLNFFEPLSIARPTLDAAMALLANSNALIIDLRDNGGGYSPSDAYLASYFFEADFGLWSSTYNRVSDTTSTVSLFSTVTGERYLGRPIYLLIGENTFSLAEKLAYGLKHFGRAQIVGQTSAGAAHAIDITILNDSFFLQVPIERNTHPVTQTDWEGRGVEPTVDALPEQSLVTAHRAALETLIEETAHERIRTIYSEIKAQLGDPPAE
ncbi:MAG: S41 family peptidase [Pseudomonadota bacterium]